ncbi:MAG: ABC transporter substrate-binding protein [Chloroflexota bacterium]
MKKLGLVSSLAFVTAMAVPVAGVKARAPQYPGGIAPTTLTVWMDAPPTGYPDQAPSVAAFEKLYPQIKVNVVDVPNAGYNQKVQTALAGGQAPDVWLWFSSVDDFGRGNIQDLTSYIKRDHLNTNQWFQPITRLRFTYKGDYYAVPVSSGGAGISFSGILYNKTLFKQAGITPPTGSYTIDQFAAMAKKLSNPKKVIYGTDAGAGDWYAVGSALPWNFGADITNANGHKFEGYMNSAAMKRTVSWLIGLQKSGASIPQSISSAVGGAYGPFYTGHVAMSFDALWDLQQMRKVTFGVGLLPFPSVPGHPTYGWADEIGDAMWAKSQHKDAAWAWMKFLSGAQWGAVAAKQYNIATPVASLWPKLGLDKDPLLSQFYATRTDSFRLASYERSQFYFTCAAAFDTAYSKALRTGDAVGPMLDDAAKQGQACLDKDYSQIAK